MNKKLLSVSIPNIIKTYGSGNQKHIDYVLVLILNTKEKILIKRRYNEFYELQLTLLKFWEENPKSKRTLPYLPGKNILKLGKTDLALKRIRGIEDYCNRLIKLDDKITNSQEMVLFFTPKNSDVESFILSLNSQSQTVFNRNDISNPVELIPYRVTKSYKKEGENQLSVDEGEIVELLQKTTTGWWLIHYKYEMGYFPCAFLKPASIDEECVYARPLLYEDTPEDLQQMLCIQNYAASNQNEISLSKSSLVKPIRRQSDGWWLVDNGSDRTGYAPVSFMRPLNTSLLQMSQVNLDRFLTKSKSCDNLLLLEINQSQSKQAKHSPTDKTFVSSSSNFQTSGIKKSLSRPDLIKASSPKPPRPPISPSMILQVSSQKTWNSEKPPRPPTISQNSSCPTGLSDQLSNPINRNNFQFQLKNVKLSTPNDSKNQPLSIANQIKSNSSESSSVTVKPPARPKPIPNFKQDQIRSNTSTIPERKTSNETSFTNVSRVTQMKAVFENK